MLAYSQLGIIVYFYIMNRLLIIISLFSSVIINAQTIDWDNFSEARMNEVMLNEMNKYVKKIHHGDSLILSSVVQEQIMPRNYNYIKNHRYYKLEYAHNKEWLARPLNDLPDTLKVKIISEMSTKYHDSNFLKGHWNEEYKTYLVFTYIENLECISYGYHLYPTYQQVATEMIKGWNASPPHSEYMNANYQNQVIVGVTTYFDRNDKTIFISFVYVD